MAPLGGHFDIVKYYFYSIRIHEESFTICWSNTKHSHRCTCSYFDERRLFQNNQKRAQVPTDSGWIVVFCIACFCVYISRLLSKGRYCQGNN